MNRCMILAGGLWQKHIASFFKSKGDCVYVVNPVETETTRLADHHIWADVNDLDEINRHIEKIRPKYITSDQSDISTMAVAKLSEKWGLPGNKPEVIEKFSDKYTMFRYGSSIGMPVPWSTLDPEEAINRDCFPLVVKPVDATNSRGFRVVHKAYDLLDCCEMARKFSKSKQVIIQEYLGGEVQITLDGICSGGLHKTIATSRKGAYFCPGISSSVKYPSNVEPALLDRIISDNDRYVELAGLEFGLTHAEYIISGSNYHLVEIAARGAGVSISNEIVPWVSGINSHDVLYASLQGEKVDVKSMVPLKRPAILQYYHENQMSDFSKDNLDKIRSLQGVAVFHFDFRGLQFASDDTNPRHSMGIYRAETEDELDAVVRQVTRLWTA